MELKVKKSAFSKAISLVGNVASQKANTLPILGNILLETEGKDTLRIVGTDLEVGIATKIPADVEKEGSITLPARKINEIIREFPEGEVDIAVAKNNAVNIRGGKAFFKIMGLSKDDFPKLPEWNEKESVELEQSLIKESLSLTSFAISHDETRYVLNGVLILIKGKKIRFVATDGRRLAYIEKDFNNTAGKNIEVILPTKAIQEILKILDWDGTVKMLVTKNHAIFLFKDSFLSTRLIEGHFPNYEQVIPKEEKIMTSASREELLQAIRRTSLLTSPDSPAIKMDFLKGKILISSRSPNMGEAKEELMADSKGGEVAIGFNPHYLIDALKNLDIDQVSLSLTEPDKPGLLKGKEGYLYVVMPMQLN